MFWWKRYEPILEQKPVSGDVAIVGLIGKELVEMLEAFPPPEHEVDWDDESFARKFRGRLHELPKLDARFVGQLFEIVRLDIEHDNDRIEWLLRNDHHREACPTHLHVDALNLLWPVVVEHLYQRKDETHGILKRKHLIDICVSAEERYRRNAMRVQ